MNKEQLIYILEQVQNGELSPKKARRKLLSFYNVNRNYSDYLSLTLDGVKPEEAARECGLL